MTLVKLNSLNSLQQNSAGIKRICAHGRDDVRSKNRNQYYSIIFDASVFLIPYFFVDTRT